MKDIREFIAAQCRKEFLKDPKEYCSQLKINESTAELYQIGVVPEDGLFAMLENAGYSVDILESLNCSDYNNRLCFPSRSVDGVISALYFGRSDASSKQPVWIRHTFDTSDLYGIDKCIPLKNYILLCEGVTDVLACANLGVANVVAYGNARLPNDEQLDILERFQTVVIAFDNDDYGKQKSDKIKKLLSLKEISAITLEYGGRDICEAMKDMTQRRLIVNQLKTVISEKEFK